MNPGTVLSGRYTLTDLIAVGGMGEVWTAQDRVLGRTVAVKVLRPSAHDEPRFAERFRDEARHAAGLSHANIARVYDFGEDGDTAYLVMELVPGTPLSNLLATAGKQSPELTRSVLGQAALALAAAHEAGVIHRDVKPGNIIVTPDGTAKLTDFGIARALDASSHTRTGEVVGTPHYLSPEQALGQPATGSSDLYALGIVGFEMLTGRRPFDAGTPVATALAQVHDDAPPLPPEVPDDLRAVIDRCLAKDPAQRPRSAAAVAMALGQSVASGAYAVPALHLTDPEGLDPVVPVSGLPTTVVPMAPPTEVVPAGSAAAVSTAAATTRMPVADEPPRSRSELRAQSDSRPSPWWWLAGLLVAAVVGYFVWQGMHSGQTPTPSPTSTSPISTTTTTTTTTTIPTTSETPTSSTTTEQTFSLDVGQYLGLPYTDVVAQLQALGLRVRTAPSIRDDREPGSVLDIAPAGPLSRGDTVLVTYAVAPAPTTETTWTPVPTG